MAARSVDDQVLQATAGCFICACASQAHPFVVVVVVVVVGGVVGIVVVVVGVVLMLSSPPFEEQAENQQSDKAKAENMEVEQAGKDDSAGSEVDICLFKIGDKVRTVAGKAKDKYDNMLAEMKSVKKTSCRVQILEGPAEMALRDYLFKNLKPFDQVDALGPISTEREEPKFKRQKCASVLFADVEG